jgi:hypothetical protein
VLNGDRFRRFAAILVAFATCVAFSGLASAQSTSASVSGRITDSSGAALEGAEVTLTNVDTEALQRTTSNGEDFYSFPNLAPVKTNCRGISFFRSDPYPSPSR